jgi:hypothetical protein
MRARRTEAEQNALDALVEHIRLTGASISLDPECTDRPDAVAVLDGQRIAWECRFIGPEGLLQFHGRPWPENGYAAIVLPWEPHMWAACAVRAKNGNVADYLSRGRTSEAWLVLHTSHLLPLGIHKAPEVLVDFRDGAASARPQFSKLWIVDAPGQEQRVWEAWDARSGVKVPTGFRLEGDEYPVRKMWLGKSRVHVDDAGHATISGNLRDTAEKILLQPLDKAFKIEYLATWPEVIAKAVKI